MKLKIALFLLFATTIVQAQAPKKMTSSDIYEAIQKSQVLASALFVAAHPDDENTSMISYLSNDVKAETAYLSITRGDGGQNLIGTELAELLGVIRTQELLAARRVDGGNQLFTRAIDFGFSKHPDETLKIWNRDEVMADVVWAIRKWQPDVVINRFDHNSAGKTHGHHTSSAVLSVAAWDLVGDKNAYPEQLKYVDAWQPNRLFLNTSWWFYGSREKFAAADKSKMASVDVGAYYPTKGMSNTEIAAISRSQHKCQGMGRTLERGSESAYLELLKGEVPTNKEDIFEGINTTWTRVKGGRAIGELLTQVELEFDFEHPENSTAKLVKAYKLLKALPDGTWKRRKMPQLEAIILACQGLFFEANANDYSATPGQKLELTMEATARSTGDLTLQKVTYLPNGIDSVLNTKLGENEAFKFYKKLSVPENTPYTTPYWLNEKGEYGMYKVAEQTMRGLPETPRALQVKWTFLVAGETLEVTSDVAYKKTDPVKGEQYRPFEVLPPVAASLQNDVYIYADDAPKTVNVVVTSMKDDLKGQVKIAHPKGWRIEPQVADFQLDIKGGEAIVSFQLFPPKGQSEGLISPIVMLNGETYTQEMVVIEYDHIPTQTVLKNEESKVVKIDLQKAGERIGYIMGAGDKIPENLEAIGYQVDLLEDKDITPENLKNYDAIIAGIRAYNTNDRMKFHQPKLLEYVENGGTYIIQYQTTWRMPFPQEKLAPYPMKLSRDRVTVEEAEVRFLAPKHPVLNTPNKITSADFDGWVQERGLYFPNEWSDDFTAILSANDPGEDPKDGGLLVAEYGKGYYVYTGYSWFRELPAGVPGAYRLFTNLISLGSAEKK